MLLDEKSFYAFKYLHWQSNPIKVSLCFTAHQTTCCVLVVFVRVCVFGDQGQEGWSKLSKSGTGFINFFFKAGKLLGFPSHTQAVRLCVNVCVCECKYMCLNLRRHQSPQCIFLSPNISVCRCVCMSLLRHSKLTVPRQSINKTISCSRDSHRLVPG